jgi:hypothetical protein
MTSNSYIHAMVYHEREAREQTLLHETIERSVRTDVHLQEVHGMGKTIAEAFMEKGRR